MGKRTKKRNGNQSAKPKTLAEMIHAFVAAAKNTKIVVGLTDKEPSDVEV